MASSAIALLFCSGGFDDGEEKLSFCFPPALRGVGGGPCSLERWLSLPLLPSRVFLVVAAGASERRVRYFLGLKRLPPSLDIEIVVVSREEGVGELAAAARAAAAALSLSSPFSVSSSSSSSSSFSSSSPSLVVADATAVPVGLDLARLRAAASLLAAPTVVISASPLGTACPKGSGAESLQKTCKGLGKVSLLAGSRGGAVARVAALGEGSSCSGGNGDDGFDAQRVVFLPASSLESAAQHSGSVRSWLCAQGSNLRALVSSSAASPSAGGPLPHASTAAGRGLAAVLLSRGGGGWGAALPASGASAWLDALVASAAAAAEGDGDFEVEVEVEKEPESKGPSPRSAKQHPSFSTTSSTYGAAPPAVAAALASSPASAAASVFLWRGGGRSSSAFASAAPSPPSASPRRLSSLLLPPLSPVLKTGSSGAAGGMLRFDIPRSRVHDKLDA